MSLRRFEIRPIASRRLRAALLLVYVLGWVSLWQTRFTGVELFVAIAALSTIFADGWRRSTMPDVRLVFGFKPLSCYALDPSHSEIELTCTRASAYPWLVVVQFATPANSTWRLHRTLVLLPDSLSETKTDDWRRLLIWTRLTRRRLASR